MLNLCYAEFMDSGSAAGFLSYSAPNIPPGVSQVFFLNSTITFFWDYQWEFQLKTLQEFVMGLLHKVLLRFLQEFLLLFIQTFLRDFFQQFFREFPLNTLSHFPKNFSKNTFRRFSGLWLLNWVFKF